MKYTILKRLTLLVLILALSLSAFACSGKDDPIINPSDTSDQISSDTTTGSVDVVPEPAKDLTIIKDGEPVVTLVRPEKVSDVVMSAFKSVMETIKKLTGTTPKLVTDAVNKYDPDTPEIYIGEVNVDEINEARRDVSYNSYKVSIIGNKLVIGAWCDASYLSAANDLNEKLTALYSDNNLVFPADEVVKGTTRGLSIINSAPVYPYGKFNSIKNCADNTYIAIIDKTDLDEFNAYTSGLSKKNYTLYTENDINGNIFRSYVRQGDGCTLLHAYYIPHSGQVRIIVCDEANLPTTGPENVTFRCSPTVTQLGISQHHAANSSEGDTIGGMGYVLRLSDGSFIIIDGGYQYEEDYRQLLKALDEQAIDPNHIVIRCWILTHKHGDHTGTFYYFSSRSSNNPKYEVQSFMLNTIAVEEHCTVNGIAGMQKPINTIKKYYPKATIYKAFAGQKYYFNDAVVNVLYSYDDFLPTILDDDENKTTLVTQIELGDQKLLFLGDTTKWNCDEMSARYQDQLHSDFVQMAHHGINENRPRAYNATAEIYRYIDPSYVFWPCNETAYQARKNININNYLLTKLNVKQLWVAKDKNVTVTLPYTGSGTVIY